MRCIDGVMPGILRISPFPVDCAGAIIVEWCCLIVIVCSLLCPIVVLPVLPGADGRYLQVLHDADCLCRFYVDC